jgi:aspartyl-tRNA(Asn)/glutamyl-tRNA(Gln) amidotransferase subunit A
MRYVRLLGRRVNEQEVRMTGNTFDELADSLATGSTSARSLTERCLARIEDEAGEGDRAFLLVDREGALKSADFVDEARRAGRASSPYAGIPISIKDLFDVAGQVTGAGSPILGDQAPAPIDAPCVARLRAAGFILIGRTNMTEFAYSGVGLNPHFGTPKSVWDRETGRIPGGSSAGAAVSVADGMAFMGLGSDTGGSCRIPAAFNGITGYKSSTGRVSTEGVFPLAATLDTVGPLANSVRCCSIVDALMAGDRSPDVEARDPGLLRFGLPKHVAMEDMDAPVSAAFENAVKVLGEAGVQLVDVPFPELAELPNINARGGISAVEAMDVHAGMIEKHGERYDPRVRNRILSGLSVTGPELVGIHRRRRDMIRKFGRLCAGLDGFLMPTVAILPPPISEVDNDDNYGRLNFLCLRNTFIGNFLDSCAISIPMTAKGEPPAGAMIMCPHGQDDGLFDTAATVEAILRT